MLKIRKKRAEALAARAHDRLAAIEAAIAVLKDDDLLDLADIFAGGDPTPLREMSTAEMERRNISL